MMAPSTIRPKSNAPKLIKLPLMPSFTIPVLISKTVSGMTSAVISAARTFPSIRKSTTMTSSAPSPKFFATVDTVASTNLLRFNTVCASMPGGKLRRISMSLLSTAMATVREFSPIRIKAVPMTTSWPSSLAEPVRSSSPISTLAISRTYTGVLLRVVTTVLAMSLMVFRRPSTRTR